MGTLVALLEECLENGDEDQSTLYAWFTGERDIIVSAIQDIQDAEQAAVIGTRGFRQHYMATGCRC